MRLRQRDLKPYTFYERQTVSETDGTTYDGWGSVGIVYANVQPAGGKLLVEMYGARLAYMKVAYLEDVSSAKEGDGVYIDNPIDTEPDYKIVAIRPWGNHFVMDLEKMVVEKHDDSGIGEPSTEVERTWRR